MSVKINNIEFGEGLFYSSEEKFKSIPWQTCAHGFVNIDFKYETDYDIWKLIVAKKYLDDRFGSIVTVLNMLYVPYSLVNEEKEDTVFTIKYFCELINELNFSQVKIFDPYFSLVSVLLKRVIKVNLPDYINLVTDIDKTDYVFYIRKNVMERYSKILSFPDNIKSFYGDSKEDFFTEEIKEINFIDLPKDITNKNVLIVDNFCSKGDIFITFAKALKEVGFKKVSLYVSHCEDLIYNGDILKTDYIDKVYTTNSILSNTSSNKICVISNK